VCDAKKTILIHITIELCTRVADLTQHAQHKDLHSAVHNQLGLPTLHTIFFDTSRQAVS
jgi:hypothetical protein